MLLTQRIAGSGEKFKLFITSKFSKLSSKKSNYIGIAGTLGKTTTAVCCRSVLEETFPTVSSTDFNPPFSSSFIEGLNTTSLKKKGAKEVIVEMGLDSSDGMNKLLDIVTPSIVIVTKIGLVNTEKLTSIDSIMDQQINLVKKIPKDGVLILNYDDPNARKLSEYTEAEVIFIGSDQKNCHVWVGNFKIDNFSNTFELNYGVERIRVESKLLGFHNVYPFLAAAALGLNFGIPITNIKKSLERVDCLDHRMAPLNGFGNSIIIDDSYNSSPAGMIEALDTLNQVPARRRVAVLGEIKNLGELTDREHRKVAAKIYKDKIDLVLLSAGEAGIIGDELLKLGFIPDRLFTGLNNAQIVSKLLKVVAKGDVALVTGAHTQRFDEIVKRVSRSAQR